jgi:hypothetical protein
MNDTSIGEPDRLGKGRRRQQAPIGLLHRHDPGSPRNGSAAARDRRRGRRPAGASLQQDIGETTGRGADVEADEAIRVDPERIEGGRELGPPRLTYGRSDGDGHGRQQVAGSRLAHHPPHPDLAGRRERLGGGCAFD